MVRLESQLAHEKVERAKDVNNLNQRITNWEIKYEEDVNRLQTDLSQLLNFTDLERSLNHQVITGL